MSRISRAAVAMAAATGLALGAAPAAHAIDTGSMAGLADGIGSNGFDNASNYDTPPFSEYQPLEANDPLVALNQAIFAETNRVRQANGRQPLQQMPELMDVAQHWSNTQALNDHMFHNPNIRAQIPSGWRANGENVLRNYPGATAQRLVQQWMDSLPHRINMLRGDYTHMGVGTQISDTNRLFSTQLFANYPGR